MSYDSFWKNIPIRERAANILEMPEERRYDWVGDIRRMSEGIIDLALEEYNDNITRARLERLEELLIRNNVPCDRDSSDFRMYHLLDIDILIMDRTVTIIRGIHSLCEMNIIENEDTQVINERVEHAEITSENECISVRYDGNTEGVRLD